MRIIEAAAPRNEIPQLGQEGELPDWQNRWPAHARYQAVAEETLEDGTGNAIGHGTSMSDRSSSTVLVLRDLVICAGQGMLPKRLGVLSHCRPGSTDVTRP